MIVKLLTGIFGSALAATFLAVPIIKLKAPALMVVILIGIGLMIVDLVEKLRERDE